MKRLRVKKTPNVEITKASEATKKSIGLPSLTLDSIKSIGKPSLGTMALGLGTLPNLKNPTPPAQPDLKAATPPMPTISAGQNGLAARQASIAPHLAQNTQNTPLKDPNQQSNELVLSASELAASFASAAETISVNSGQTETFLAIASKIEKHISAIEKAVIDEQDTSIIHASKGEATTIIQQPFLPTEVPQAQSESSFLDKLLSLAGWVFPALSAGLSLAGQWLGSLWTTFSDTYLSEIKNIITLGWSRVVSGFNAVSTWITSSINTIVSWVDTSVSTVFGWVQTAANKLKELWSSFDLSKFDILNFDLGGLWSKLQNLDVFGEWGKALKTVFGIFGGTGLETLKTVFDTVSKVWGFMKPIVGTIGKFARFLGPVGFLFGLATQGDEIAALIGDVAKVVGAETSEERTIGIKKALSHAARILAEMILPESLVDKFLNSAEQENAIETANKNKAIEATGDFFGDDYRIKDEKLLAAMDSKSLEAMANSGDFSDEDEEKLRAFAEAAKKRELETAKTESVLKEPDSISNEPEPVLREQDIEISSEPREIIKATEASTRFIPETPIVEREVKLPTYGSLDSSNKWAHDFYPSQFFGKSVLHDLYPDAYKVKYGDSYNESKVEAQESKEWEESNSLRTDLDLKAFEDGLSTVDAELLNKFGAGPVAHFYPEEYELIEELSRKETKKIMNAINAQSATQTESMFVEPPLTPAMPSPATSTTALTISTQSPGTQNLPIAEAASVPEPQSKDDSQAPAEEKTAIASGGSNRATLAANFATRKAEPGSTGYCARYVANGLQAAGYQFVRNPMAYQYSTNGTLRKMGFEQYDPRTTEAKPGDISVMGPRYPGHAGHISIFNGRNWVSDFVQRNESPYRSVVSSQWVTRWRDTGNTQLTPEELAQYEAAMNSTQSAMPYATPQNIDLSALSEVMSSLINTGFDLFAPVPQKSREAGSNQAMPTVTNNNTPSANLELDQLLTIPNGFD